MIKHIFLDMDNTLLQSDGSISEQTSNFLNEIDIPVTLVSARAPIEMRFAINELNLSGEQFAFNGGLIYQPLANNQLSEIQARPLNKKVADQIIRMVRSDFPKVSLSWYTKQEWFAERVDEGIEYETGITHLSPKLVNYDEYRLKDDDFFKIMLVSFDLELKGELVKAIEEMNITDVATKSTGEAYYEITNSEAIKRRAIEYLIKRDGLKRDELAAFGDGENDIEMFKMVGHPIAMGNATDEVKEYAEFVTDSNDEDGIISGIKKLTMK